MSLLDTLTIYGNDFSGTIPTEIAGMERMRHLEISNNNRLQGTVPILGSAINIAEILASNCNLSGTIGSDWGTLEKINEIDLSNNHFTGTLPTELGRLTELSLLRLNGNHIYGAVPDELCSLRGGGALDTVVMDCSVNKSGIPQIYCPPGCCSECCSQETGVCVSTAG